MPPGAAAAQRARTRRSPTGVATPPRRGRVGEVPNGASSRCRLPFRQIHRGLDIGSDVFEGVWTQVRLVPFVDGDFPRSVEDGKREREVVRNETIRVQLLRRLGLLPVKLLGGAPVTLGE